LKDFPGGVAKLKNIASQAFDREVFVDRTDESVARLNHHAIIAVVRNGPAGSQRHQARAAPAAYAMIDLIVMDQGGATSALGAEPFGQHAEDFLKFRESEMTVRIGRAHQFK
jgi:hypothetical protein